MPRVLVAPDSFKGTLSATEAAMAIGVGLKAGWPALTVDKLPLADGGEGTLDALLAATSGVSQAIRVHDTFGEVWSEHIGLLDNGDVVVEAALFCGRCSREHGPLDPLVASSRGLGEAIEKALAFAPKRLLIGLGGTVSVDGGLGLLQALGAVASGDGGASVEDGGGALEAVRSVHLEAARERLDGIEVVALCDVNAPLLGPSGARLYMAQKGADSADEARLHAGLANLARVIGDTAAALPGAGAAGGLGFALASVGASLVPGAAFILDATDAEARIGAADIVVTGEGCLDRQTAQGKLPAAVASLARQAQRQVFAIVGKTTLADEDIAASDFDGVYVSHLPQRSASPRPPFLEVRDAARSLGAAVAASWSA